MNINKYKEEMSKLDLSDISDEKIFEMYERNDNDSAFRAKNTIGKCKTKKYGMVYSLRIASIAAVLCIISTVTVMGSESIIKFLKNFTFTQSNKTEGQLHKYDNADSDKTINVNEESIDSKVKVNLVSVIPDASAIYVRLQVNSVDGGVLYPYTESESVSPNSNSFENAFITDGTNKIQPTNLRRVDDLTDESMAEYELMFIPGENGMLSSVALDSNKYNLVLENIRYSVSINKELDIISSDLGCLISSIKNEPVVFIKNYSDAKIVKAEYGTKFVNNKEKACIDITYEYSKTETKDMLLKLKMFNKVTNESATPERDVKVESKEELEGEVKLEDEVKSEGGMKSEREEVVVNTIYKDNQDGTITVSYISDSNTFFEDLSNCCFLVFEGNKKKTISGHWEFDLNLNMNSDITYDLETPVGGTLTSMNVKFNCIKVADTGVFLYGNADRFAEPEGYDIRPVKVLDNEGNILSVVKHVSGGTRLKGDEETVQFSAYFDNLIDKEKVACVYFGDIRIDLR